MQEDPRLDRDRIRVPRRDSYEKRPVLSATIHPDIKRTLVAISKRTGMTVSQVADEVLYSGLIEMQELDAPVRPGNVFHSRFLTKLRPFLSVRRRSPLQNPE